MGPGDAIVVPPGQSVYVEVRSTGLLKFTSDLNGATPVLKVLRERLHGT